MNKFFPEIKKNFGFGIMRMAMREDDPSEVDMENFREMVDLFLAEGFNYFDTAHGYIDGKSELVIRQALTSRYPRDSYILTDKLTRDYFETAEDVRKVFEEQLACCGVEYFDFYLMHSQNRNNYDHFNECKAYETALELKAEGKIRHFGISFHDNAEMLERILTEHPEIEVVQIQLNYLDYEEDSIVDSRKALEVCRRFGKPVIVMEPVRGGQLTNLNEEACRVFDSLGDASYASYAIRFAAGFDNVAMVLSGMKDVAQMKDNTGYMKEFKPLDETEMKAIRNVIGILKKMDLIPCTGCRYCVDGCPRHIPIPNLFNCINVKKTMNDDMQGYYYKIITTGDDIGRASDCIGCGKCEKVCPQHLEIREQLKVVAEEFE